MYVLFSMVYLALNVWHSTYQRLYILSQVFLLFFVCLFFCFFLGLLLWHMEVPRPEFKLELELLAYATATAMPDP